MKIFSGIAAKLPTLTTRKTRKTRQDLQHKAHLAHVEADYLRQQLAQAHRANLRLKAELEEDSVGNR